MVNDLKYKCSFSTWYPQFVKNSLEAVVLPIPEDVSKYLEEDAFLLPVEATSNVSGVSEWADGSPVEGDSSEDSECQPTFPTFSRKIQDVINDFGAVFVKSNWRTPSDAMWVAPTKTLKCETLEEVYLLLKSSDRISEDLDVLKNCTDNKQSLQTCLVLKRWRDINPSTEFRCFVVKNELIGICQRDVSQYYKHMELEKYDIQRDINTLFLEHVKDRFGLTNYSFDVIRYKKDKVKIVDFGPLDESVTKGTLFTYEELKAHSCDAPEFRFIAEDMGIQPNNTRHYCVPQEINEFFRSASEMSMMDMIRNEVENQDQECQEASET
ncbi:cell division cycle protein 123 homolog [Orussus abietinus]|uniref:cell division cycle protein 123 homolog n=1 Tax=Orussus abietinus TaxID=222816 RepID=UPI0006268849|nr:cell division cycle protein 123 homolog [Orussus abietinus]